MFLFFFYQLGLETRLQNARPGLWILRSFVLLYGSLISLAPVFRPTECLGVWNNPWQRRQRQAFIDVVFIFSLLFQPLAILGKPILTPDWLHQTWQHRDDPNFKADDPNFMVRNIYIRHIGKREDEG